jgi:hypothetical protein
MSIELFNLSTINFSNIKYSNPQKNKGSYTTELTYNDKEIYILTPKLKLINEINIKENKCSIDLEIDDDNKQFYETMSNFDDFNILKVHNNSKEWFGKEFPIDVVEDFFSSSLKHKNIPKLKLKLNNKNNNCLVYDLDKKIIDNIKSNSDIICVLKHVGLKFLSQQVISEWVPIQIKTNYISPDDNYLINDKFNISTENIEPQESTENIEPQESTENIEPQESTENIEPQESTENIEPQESTELYKEIEKKRLIEYEEENNLQDLSNNIYDINNYELIIKQTKMELEKYKLLSMKKEKELNELKNNIKQFMN